MSEKERALREDIEEMRASHRRWEEQRKKERVEAERRAESVPRRWIPVATGVATAAGVASRVFGWDALPGLEWGAMCLGSAAATTYLIVERLNDQWAEGRPPHRESPIGSACLVFFGSQIAVALGLAIIAALGLLARQIGLEWD
jgi:hypothetical protein